MEKLEKNNELRYRKSKRNIPKFKKKFLQKNYWFFEELIQYNFI